MNLKRIMVAADGSEHSMRAARYALDLSKLTGAEIILIYCHRPFPALLGEPFFQKAVIRTLEKSNQLLEPYRELCRERGVSFSDRILEGSPGRMISEAAEIEQCDMIIMGSRGRTDLEGLFLGSVTHRVLTAATCPVLVVR
jgi:nucleotide-binding universal stress UspA family protein